VSHSINAELEKAIISFCYVAQIFQIKISPQEILFAALVDLHDDPLSALSKLASRFHLKGKKQALVTSQYKNIKVPAIAKTNENSFVAVLECLDGHFIIFCPKNQTTKRVSISESNLIFSGDFLSIGTSRRTPELHRPFGYRWLFGRANAFRKILRHIIFASLAIQIFATATPLFSQVIIDKVLMHQNLSALVVLGTGMCILIVFEFVLTLLRNQHQTHIASKIDLELGVKVKQHLLRLPLHYFETRSKGTIVGLFRELESVRSFITGSSATSIVDLSFLIVFLPLMYFYSPLLTAVSIITAFLMVITSVALHPLSMRKNDDTAHSLSDCQNSLIENISGIKTIKSLSAERRMGNRWESAFASNVLATLEANSVAKVSSALSSFIQRASTLAILWIGATLAMKSEISVGQLIAFQMLSTRVLHPMMRISQLWSDLKRVEISMSRLADILNFPQESQHQNSKRIMSFSPGAIEISKMSFAYPGSNSNILNNISLNIPFGSKVGLIGKSGSGKSTLVKLIQRLHYSEHGKIRYGGIDVRSIDLPTLRNRITLVHQDSDLFKGTILENISMHAPWHSAEKIIGAARLAKADEFIMDFKDGYATLIGDNGVQLSGGQRQRIALARAILDEPDVLILDEATSALDYKTEMDIFDNVMNHFRERTVVVITHRLHLSKLLDSIHIISDGFIQESGSHTELLLKRGQYFGLYNSEINAVSEETKAA
jgi:subfamily B ATP-binding cassette protein HlyB/CyaB